MSSDIKIECVAPDNPVEHAEKIIASFPEFADKILEARYAAMREGIKVNSVVINKRMVRVPPTPLFDGRTLRFTPDMVCGLNVYLSDKDLPDGYSFAVFEGPENRLAQFEAIGMEPDELRKAAELYRKIKEELK